ncbi:hypothetical protein SDC9_108995 [bioreactor metagenome]|uniref:Uncharacterized protein n=1 Tax=bioreactor metagenome TaxID=1076179 RepID=A0A645B9H7_9ZZZZ
MLSVLLQYPLPKIEYRIDRVSNDKGIDQGARQIADISERNADYIEIVY